jgi:hypothetical protein
MWQMRNEVEAAYEREDYLLANYVEVEGPLETPCLEWQRSRQGDGYGNVWYEGHSYLAHRLSWTLHNGPIPEYLFCLHRCDNPPCGNPGHLFLGTNSDNILDAYSKGRLSAVGELNGCVRLSDADVANIKGLALRHSWLGIKIELARRYNVGNSTNSRHNTRQQPGVC